MRITQARFSVPFCLFTEPMPDKARSLLVYLLSVSDFGGGCTPGYDAMKRAIRAHDGDNGSNATVRRYLAFLHKAGWIFSMKKTNSKMHIWLQIPHRFRAKKTPKTTISVVHG